jgi:signal peptidase II
MRALIAGLLFVPLGDQALKHLLRHWLGSRSFRLGPVGALRIVESRIWLARIRNVPKLTMLWSLWLLSAGALAILAAIAPSSGWYAGLLLGGSLSHALETSLRGTISDYVCPRFWPTFNLADVAITVGAVGIVLGRVNAI